MEHRNTFCKNYEERTNLLMKRLHNYFDDSNYLIHSFEEQNLSLLKLQTILLTAEIYDYTRQYIIHREDILSEYFSEMTLKQCLMNVVEIEKLLELIPINVYCHSFQPYSATFENDVENSSHTDHRSYNQYEDYICLHEKGLEVYFDKIPSLAHSVIWCEEIDDDKHYMFGRLFSKAKETLDENDKKERASDPEQLAYHNVLQQRNLSRHIAKKTSPYKMYIDEQSKGDIFHNHVIEILKKAEDAPFKGIYIELGNALDLLRHVFMTDAEDIYYIRTGDFSLLKKVYDIQLVEKYYTDLPFKKYYIAKERHLEQYSEEMMVALEEWRSNNKYIGRPLSQEEYNVFLQMCKKEVIENMEKYADLWKLRMHSGGLDVAVTPENFARMFYRRKGVDRYFIELQWQLEYLSRKIEENKDVHTAPEQSPEQVAVGEFVDKITKLVIDAYNTWNNRRIVPSVHMSEVQIVIEKEKLISYIQGELKNNFDALKDICYPSNSESNHNFCRYVSSLQKEGYFGLLPKKHLAKIIAPIIKIKESTVSNYLSN